MKRISFFAVVTDSILAATGTFALLFTVIRYYTKNVALGLGAGIAIAVLCGVLTFIRLRSKRGKALATGKKLKQRQAFKLYLCTASAEVVNGLIASAVGGNITERGIATEDRVYIAQFAPLPLSPNEICRAAAFDSDLKKTIVCNEADEAAVQFAGTADVGLLFADEIFDKLAQTGRLPEVNVINGAAPKIRNKLKGAIKRSNAIKLFWCGIWLTAFSYFTFFPVYYIVAGGLALMLSAVCLIFGKRE